MSYRLTMFGPPTLVDETGETPAGLGQGKPLAVLCYLAREGEVRRETVTALLWGDRSESKARNAFRQALHRLRGALGEELVPHDPDTVRIAGGADLWVDVDEFDRALVEGRPEDAVELVDGDFLEGFAAGEPGFDHWADGQRARLRGRFLGALRDAAGAALAEGRLEEAVLHARRLAERDPLDSAAALLQARTLTAAGRAEEARRLLAEHAGRYREQVGEEPPEEVAAALGGLEDDDATAELAATVAAAEPTFRPEALNALMAAWRTAVEGESLVVVLRGERGAGKTWLVDELSRRVRPLDRPIVLRGAERMGPHGLPYAPVAEALRGVLRARGLGGASTHLLAEAARLLPELRDRFDLPIPAPIDDQTDRLRFYEGVASVLDAVAFEQPVLLALEGLEEADAPTLELVHFLTSRLRDTSILFVLSCETGRDRDVTDRLGGVAEVLALDPLDPPRIERLLEVRLPALDPTARAEVAAAADGSPGRALELGQRRLRGEAIGGPPVPMEDALRGRLAGRTPRERRILLVLALLGRPLPIRIVAAATHLPEGAVLESVAPLRTAGLVREREHGIELAEGPVGALVLESTGAAGRSLLAGWTLEAMVAERSATDAELAALAIEADRREEAARYAEAAGRTAAGIGAHDLARDHLVRAMTWTGDPATRARVERTLAGLGVGSLRLGAGAAEPEAGAPTAPGATRAPRGDTGPRDEHGSRARLGILVGALGAIVILMVLGIVELPDRDRARVTAPERVVRDTLVLVRIDPAGGRTRLAFTGDPETALDRRAPLIGGPEWPRWVDSLRAAGLPALVSPDRQRVAVERSVGDERELLSLALDRSDGVRLDAGASRFEPLGWSPQGSWILYRRGGPGAGGGLWAARVRGGAPVPIDTTAREIDEAAWSPDGTRVAWTARAADPAEDGSGRAVFVAFADGTSQRRLTDHEDDDYHVVWAPDGERVAFTSDRTGDAEIYAVEVRNGRLWRLTWDDAHDDRPAISPDGQYLAFESTRGGEAAVYVMSSWGGQPIRVSGEGQRVAHDGWRGYPPPHLSHLRVRVPGPLEVGERGQVVVEPVFSDYVARNRESIRWRALDPDVLDLASSRDGDPLTAAAMADTTVVARSEGLGRLAISAGGWLEDTVFVKVGMEPARLDEAELRRGFPLSYGLRVAGRVGTDALARPGRISLVAPQEGAYAGGEWPLRVAALQWGPDGRVTFQVEREEHTELLDDDEVTADGLDFALVVGGDGFVAFSVQGAVRWRSTLRVTGTGIPLHRVRLRVEPGDVVAGGVEDLTVVVGGGD